MSEAEELQKNKPYLSSYGLFFSQISDLVSLVKDQIEQNDKLSSSLENSNLHDFVLEDLKLENSPDLTKHAFEILKKLNQEAGKQENKIIHSSIFQMLSQNYLSSFLCAGVFKLITVCLLFSAPFFLDQFTNSLNELSKVTTSQDSHPTIFTPTKNIVYINAGFLALSFILYSFCDSQYSLSIKRLSLQLSSYLQANIYAHALLKKQFTMPLEQSNETSSSSPPSYLYANLNNLITIDVNTIINFLISFHETWSLVLKLLVGVYMLYLKMKSAVIVGFSVTIFLMLCNFYIAKKIGNIFEKILEYKDERIGLMRDVFRGIRSIQLLRWQNLFFNKIIAIRNLEFRQISYEKYMDALCVFFWASSSLAISAVTFILYYKDHHSFSSVHVFTAIYLFEMLIQPLNALPWTISGLYMSRTSFTRFNQFLKFENVFKFEQKIPTNTAIYIKNIIATWPSLTPSTNNDEVELNSIQNINNNSMLQNNQHVQQQQLKQKQFSLKIQGIQIPKGSFVVVYGPTASGKSAFLKTILSELNVEQFDESTAPSIKIEGSLAYVSQTSWLLQQSIRDNILFNIPYDRNFYRACIYASCLHQDISSFNSLDGTNAGINGSNLSGGQQQRINVARALYSRKDIYLLDNIFSSLDSEVADHIFSFGLRSLLRDKTVILASSTDRYNMYADFIAYVNDFNEVELIPNENKYEFNFNQHIDLNQVQIYDQEFNALLEEQQTNNKLEMRETGQINSTVFWSYLHHIGLCFSIVILLSVILMQASSNYYYIWLKNFVNLIDGKPPVSSTPPLSSDPHEESKHHLNEHSHSHYLKHHIESPHEHPSSIIAEATKDNFLTYLTILCGMNLLITFVRSFSYASGNLKASKGIFINLFQKVMFGPSSFFSNHSLGSLLNRFGGDISAIDYQISFNLNIVLKVFFSIIGSFAVITIQLPISMIVIAAILVFYYYLQSRYRIASRELKRLDSANSSALLNHINESALGIQIIRAFEYESIFNQKFFNLMKNSNTTSFLLQMLGIWLSLKLQLLSLLLTISLLTYSCYLIGSEKSSIDSNTLALCLVYSIEITNLLHSLIQNITSTEKEFISLERINQFIDIIDKENSEKQQSKPTYNSLTQKVKKLKNNFSVEFHDVFLSYEKHAVNSVLPRWVLNNVSFQLEKGKKYGIIGRTGSGKSSLINCLLRLYEHQSGDIYLNGVNTMLLNDDDISKEFGVIPQNPFVFKGSLKENIDPFNKYEESQIQKILLKLLSKTDQSSYQSLRNLEFQISEGGSNLSEGEKQLISVARVLLTASPILCLDEATSNLDLQTELIISDCLSEIKSQTVIFITHRLELLNHFDLIFLMNEGSIVEQGTLNQLQMNPNSCLNTGMFN